MAQMPIVEEGAEPPPYFPRTLVTLCVVTPLRTLRVRRPPARYPIPRYAYSLTVFKFHFL